MCSSKTVGCIPQGRSVPTDTSEKGLESLIVASLCDEAGYVAGDSNDYDRDHAVDLVAAGIGCRVYRGSAQFITILNCFQSDAKFLILG